MTYFKPTRNTALLFTAAVALGLGACTSAMQADAAAVQMKAPEQSASSNKSLPGYSKPGPGVTVGSNYSGHSDLNIAQNVVFTLNDSYDSGVLRVKVLPTEGLEILSGLSERSFQMSGNAEHSFPVTFMAKKNGQLPLNILVTVDQGVGSYATLSSSITLYSGSSTFQKREVEDIGQRKTSAVPGVKVMDAEETIIQ